MFKNFSSSMKKFSFLEETIVFKYLDRKHNFPKHIHHDDFMIGASICGKSIFTIENKTYEVEEGMLCIIPSKLVHFCTPHKESKNWRFITTHPSLKLLQNIANAICKENTVYSFSNYFFKDIELSNYLKNIVFNTLDTEIIYKEDFLNFLNILFERYAKFEKTKKLEKPEKFQVLFDYLKAEKYCLKHLSFYKMAEIMKMNPYYFHRLFSKNIGLTPHDFIKALRVSKASKLLEENKDLASIALESGFYDQAHFTKSFKRQYCITPKEFKIIS